MVVRDLKVRSDAEIPFFVSAQARSSFRLYGGSLLDRPVVWLVEWDIMPKEFYNKWITAGCSGKFWLVLSHYDFNVIDDVVKKFAPHSEVKERIRHWDSAAYLFELKPKEMWPLAPLAAN